MYVYIYIFYLCIFKNDCSDGSDEDEKCKKKFCKDNMYKCRNNHCIDKLLLCNGLNDCGDNSDEDHCSHGEKMKLVNCTKDEFRCHDTNICLSKIKRYLVQFFTR